MTDALCDPVDQFVQCAVAACGNDFVAVIAYRFARMLLQLLHFFVR